MSIILTGSAGAATTTTPLTATIVSIANNGSGQWRVQTSSPHYFGSDPGGVLGDYVFFDITGGSIAPLTAYAFIIVIDDTHFDVPAFTYTATGTGTATDLSLTPQIFLPTDGDTGSLQLSGILSGFSYILHRTQYLNLLVWGIGQGAWTFNGPKTFNGAVQVNGALTAFDGLAVAGANVSLAQAFTVTVASATGNAVTPIVATLATAQALNPGDLVHITGGGGNTAINGDWILSAVSGATISLLGSTGNGTYVANSATLRRDVQIEFTTVRTQTRVLHGPWFDGTAWTLTPAASSTFAGFRTTLTTQQIIGWDIDLPDGASIVSAAVAFTPATGHAAVPSVVPQLHIIAASLATNAEVYLNGVNDPNTGSVGAYEGALGFSNTPVTPILVDNARLRYIVYFTSEGGGNALAGADVYGATVAFTTSTPGQI